MKNTNIYFVVIVVLVIALLFVWVNASKNKIEEKKKNLTSREVALTCTTDMATEYHIHPQLIILVNGEEVQIPQSLGVRPTCMTSIHTHNEKNVLHVEAPIQKDFTLGDFFAVWEKDFSNLKLLDNIVTDKSEIVVMVNGEHVDTYENTILRDKDKIVIEYKQK
ncbi:hypothetical protein EXS45_01580 [Candidatus Nomurabacteria bacterium]|nr:hypothetical protein [Candidatus Nomurabacteria bacterium]